MTALHQMASFAQVTWHKRPNISEPYWLRKKTINSRPVVRGGHYTKWLVLVTWRSTENQRTRSYRSNTKNNLTTIHSRLRAKAQLDLVDISWSDGLSEFYNADTNCPMTGNFKTEVPNGSTIDENNLQCQKSPSNDQVPDLHRTQNYRRSLLFPAHIPSNQNTLIQFKINTPHRTCYVTLPV